MAKKISDKKLRTAKDRILHDGSFLEKEAYDLKITKDELINQFVGLYEGGKKNTQFKAVLETSAKNSSRIPKEELEKYTIPASPRKRKTTVSNAVAPTPASEPKSTLASEPESTLASEPESVSALIDKLTNQKKALERELASKKEAFDKNKAIYQIREETLLECQQLLEKAQIAVETARVEYEESKISYEEAKTQFQDTEYSVLELEEEIQDLKTKDIYLVGPWFTDPLPKYGTFISTAEDIEGITVQEVPEKYLPEATLEGVLLFDYVPDYKKARIFCGLIKQFKAENKKFKLLVSSSSLQQLIEMYFGQ